MKIVKIKQSRLDDLERTIFRQARDIERWKKVVQVKEETNEELREEVKRLRRGLK